LSCRRNRETREEGGARHDLLCVKLFVRLEFRLVARLADDDAVPDLTRVAHKLEVRHARCRVSREPPEGHPLRADDKATGLLELDRKEEGGGGVDALEGAAARIRTARRDVGHPEGESRRVGFAPKEVEVVLANEK